MSTIVHAENLHEHFGKTDEATSHSGEVSVEWLHTAAAKKDLETGSREYQREKVAPLEWKQNIMRTILSNRYAKIPQIHIRVTNNGVDLYSFELIDGQQRVTAILDFLNGEYRLPKEMMTYDKIDIGNMNADELKMLRPSIYNRIMGYRITNLWYENLSDDQVSTLFVEVLNNTNDMTAQEMRNAMRGLFSTYVRDRARFEKQHELFKRITEKDGKKEITYLKHLPKIKLKGRMEVDEWLSELIYLAENGTQKGVSPKQLTEWVRNIQSSNGFATMGSPNFNPKRREWDALLDFSYKVITSVNTDHKSRLSPMVAMMLVLYAHETEKLGKKIDDMKQFTSAFFNTIVKWSDAKTKLYMNEVMSNGKQMPPMEDLFGGKNPNAIGTIFSILNREMKDDPTAFGLIELDSRESFSRKDIIQKWKEQDKKCFYTGRVLTEDELVGDHYIPRSWGIAKGGVTEYQNLVVTDQQTNLAKLSMHGDDYLKKIAK